MTSSRRQTRAIRRYTKKTTPARIHMANQKLESVALTLVADGKGILAADETAPDTETD
jgi:hypothetical protein